MNSRFIVWGIRVSTRLLHIAICACLLLGVAAIPARAQGSASGSVVGQIVDQQGAVVPAADVKMVDPRTSGTFTAVTNDVGRYTITNVPPGTYDVTVTKQGFSAAKLAAQKIDVGQVLTINLTLQLGATTTTVEVQATAGAELQTLNATIGSTITGDSVLLLPNLGRDASALSVLQVGVTPTGNVAGAATDQNAFQLDGGFNTNDMDGSNAIYTPGNGYSGTAASGGTPSGVIPTPVESIEEFKVGTSQQTADFAGAAGSQVQMVTKRGTNSYHGSLYEYYFGSNVGAANLWKNNHTPDTRDGLPYTPLPSTHRNRFGVAVGGPMAPKFWGGKTYFFFNYEGMRFPNTISFERYTPTQLMRAGVIQVADSAGNYQPYNLNPFPLTVAGKTYQPAQCGGGPCDPRGIGLNPIVSQIWKYMPLPNDPQFGDQYNSQYLGNVSLPQTSNFFVGRIDHDFGEKWRFMSSYRYYAFSQLVTTQTDMGGLLPGSTFGQYSSAASRPQKPSYLVGGLTTTITPNLTNDFRVSYTRLWWQWGTAAGPPQLPGLGGVVEIGGESANALIPYNVNSQSTRQRFWDGQDQFYSDNLSLLHVDQIKRVVAAQARHVEELGKDQPDQHRNR